MYVCTFRFDIVQIFFKKYMYKDHVQEWDLWNLQQENASIIIR